MSLADSLRLTLFMLLYDRNNGYAGDCINCITGGGKSCRLELISPFVGVLAENFLKSVCHFERRLDRAWFQRAITFSFAGRFFV